jgi:Protein of unknown function (DUF4089)
MVYVWVAFRPWCCDEDLRFFTTETRSSQKEEKMEERELEMRVFVEQMALAVDLQLRDEYKDGVVANFERICNIAQVVLEFELPEDVEAAPIFEPL